MYFKICFRTSCCGKCHSSYIFAIGTFPPYSRERRMPNFDYLVNLTKLRKSQERAISKEFWERSCLESDIPFFRAYFSFLHRKLRSITVAKSWKENIEDVIEFYWCYKRTRFDLTLLFCNYLNSYVRYILPQIIIF